MSVCEGEAPNTAQLKLLHGGKGGSNWLWNLPKGSVFISAEKASTNFIVFQFQLVEKTQTHVLLMEPNFVGMPPKYSWVDPVKFSMQMDLKELLALGQEENELPDGEQSDTLQSG